jgi:ABC-2 type transport system ATP-binding protein
MPNQAIEFHGVTKSYRRRLMGEWVPALSYVSFEVSPGEVCAFLGPNGAGKTTSINLLMGFLPLDQGDIRVLNHPPGDVHAKEHIGFLPENFAFYKYLNAEKLLRFHLRLSGRGLEGSEALIAELLRKVKLDSYQNLKIGKYSRGMVQRLGLAQALLSNPQLLVLDEPTSGLDPAGRKEVRDLILALKSEGKTIFLSSHLLSEVEQISDRVIIINRGHVVRAGRLEEMLAQSDRVEIAIDRLPEHLLPVLAEHQATSEPTQHGIRITVAAAQKRAMAETLWAAGCDVISINPVRNTLEDLFLKSVGEGEKKAS